MGKSTVTALLIRWLNDHGHKSILAVDADSNVNLNDLLGVEASSALGSIREEMKETISNLPGGMTKQQFLEYRIHQSLLETPNFDLITMGRPEGPGCYCYANNLLRDILKQLSDNYQYVVIDNEAGMEHLSRRTTQHIDYMLIVSDPTVRGVQTAGRISRLLQELDTRVNKKYLVINRARGELSSAVKEQIVSEGLELLAVIPDDNKVARIDAEGQAMYHVSTTSAAFQSIDAMLSALLPDVIAETK